MMRSLPRSIGSMCALPAHDHAPAAGLVGLLDAPAADDDPAGGEVRALDVLHQAAYVGVGIVDVGLITASIVSLRLCGGMFVAMPTAIP